MNFDFNELARSTARLTRREWTFAGVMLNINDDEQWKEPVAVFDSTDPDSSKRRVFNRLALMRQIALEEASAVRPHFPRELRRL